MWQIWNFRNIFVDGVKTYQQLVNYIRVENRLELDGVPSKLKGIITKCWSGNVNIRPPFTEIISQFNQVIIDCTILDTIGREIWSNNFYDTVCFSLLKCIDWYSNCYQQDEVPVGKFVNAILQQQKLYVKVNDPRLTCLKFILGILFLGVCFRLFFLITHQTKKIRELWRLKRLVILCGGLVPSLRAPMWTWFDHYLIYFRFCINL